MQIRIPQFVIKAKYLLLATSYKFDVQDLFFIYNKE